MTKRDQNVTMDRASGVHHEPVFEFDEKVTKERPVPSNPRVKLFLKGDEPVDIVLNGSGGDFRCRMFAGDQITLDRVTADSYIKSDPDIWEEVK